MELEKDEDESCRRWTSSPDNRACPYLQKCYSNTHDTIRKKKIFPTFSLLFAQKTCDLVELKFNFWPPSWNVRVFAESVPLARLENVKLQPLESFSFLFSSVVSKVFTLYEVFPLFFLLVEGSWTAWRKTTCIFFPFQAQSAKQIT